MWLNGGPGCSSLIGGFFELGPFTLTRNDSGEFELIENPYSWSKLGNLLIIDQPVGTGYSTTRNGFATDETQVVRTFAHLGLCNQQNFFLCNQQNFFKG